MSILRHTERKNTNRTGSARFRLVSIWILTSIVLCGSQMAAYAWTDTGGGDHLGADWTISAGTSIAGNHYNIGTFTVNNGITATIAPWDGANFGSCVVSASVVNVIGTINADTAGYRGGPAASGGYGEGPGGYVVDGGGQGSDGVSSSRGAGGGAYGGDGGNGGGVSGDATPGAGQAGGTSYGNATNEQIQMGAGAGGHYVLGGGGGGSVSLSGDSSVTVSGSIIANGQAGDDVAGVQWGASGGGAGGGILLKSSGGSVTVSGTLSVNGGKGGLDNSAAGGNAGGAAGGGGGGRIKIFYGGSYDTTGSSITATGGLGGDQWNSPEPGADGTIAFVALNMSPAAPALHNAPFDHEETPNTTPSFEFTAWDPDGTAGIIYEIQYSINSDFSANVITNLSDTDLGFTNAVTPVDTSPFTESNKVEFVIQPGDALSDSATNSAYYWRVRAKDDGGEGGSGGWSDWAGPNSFRVDTSLSDSQWAQTTDEQFEKGALASTKTNGSDAVELDAAAGGTIISPEIDFDWVPGAIDWGELLFADDETNGDIVYDIQYWNGSWQNTAITGQGTSPVDISSLDTNTHNRIRIVASLTNNTGTPYLYDWAVTWLVTPFPEVDILGTNGISIANGSPATVASGTDFGNLAKQGESVTNTFTIANTGTTNLYLNGATPVVVLGAYSSDFTVIQPSTTNIAPAGNVTFTIVFDPIDVGTRTGLLSIANSDSDENPYTFSLRGDCYSTEAEMGIYGNGTGIVSGDTSPDPSDGTAFGNVQVGVTNYHVFTVTNGGLSALYLSGTPVVAISGSGDFAISTQPASTNLAAAGSTTFVVSFAPSGTGSRTADLSILNSDSDENPYTFRVNGTGVNPYAEIAVFGNGTEIADGDLIPSATDGTDFGSPAIDATNDVVFTITNNTSSLLNLFLTTAPAISISGDAEFSIIAQPGSTNLAAGDTTSFTIRFVPPAIASYSASISIADSDTDENPYNFNIQGAGMTPGPEIGIYGKGIEIANGDTTPSLVDGTDFGQLGVSFTGTVSQAFIITNSASTNLFLHGTPVVDITGTHASDFTTNGALIVTNLAGNGSTSFAIIFDPLGTGLRSATVSIANDDINENPYTFDIQGYGSVGHNADTGTQCVNCHAHGLSATFVPRYGDQDTRCKSCHNPTGTAADKSDIANHVVNGTNIVDCGSCHDVHGSPPTISTNAHNGGLVATNLVHIRTDLTKYVPQATNGAVFQRWPEDFAYSSASGAPWNGICQSCHTNTSNHQFDNSADNDHRINWGCTACHWHETGFTNKSECTDCHGVAQGSRPRREVMSNFLPASHHTNGVSTNFDCYACHFESRDGRWHRDDLVDNIDIPNTPTVAYEESHCYSCHTNSGTASTDLTVDFAKALHHPIVNSDTLRAAGRSVECADCHDPHSAKGAAHTYSTTATSARNQVSDATYGASGYAVNYGTLGNFVAPPTNNYTLIRPATYEYEICFKCHSSNGWSSGSAPNGISANGSAATPVMTDVAQEFSPRNKSGHPVVTGLNNYPNSTTPKPLTASDMKAPWASNVGSQTMKCSDCHNTDASTPAAQGPHGSAAQFMLRGPNAANWPNHTANNFNTSWCANCHNDALIHAEDADHETHCYKCHVVIPHGSKMSRLQGDADGSMPSRYAWNNDKSTLLIVTFSKNTPSGYQREDCRTTSACSRHSGEAPPDNENW